MKEGQQHFEILNRLMFYLPRFGNAEDLTNCKVNIVAALGGFDSEIQFNIIRQWIVSYSQIVPLSKQDCLSEIFFSLFPIEGEFKFYFIKFNFWNKEAVNLFESQFVENNSEYIEKLWKLIRNDTPSPKSERAEISKSERAEIYIYQTLASVNGVGLFAAEKIITNFSNNQYECDILQLSIITWILGDHESFHRYRNLDFELESQGAKFFDLWIQRVCESRTCQSDLWEEFASSLDGNDQLEAFDYYYDPFLLLSILFGVERDYDLSNSFLLKAINRAHMSVEFHSIWTSRILDYLKSDSPIVSKVFRGVYDSRNV